MICQIARLFYKNIHKNKNIFNLLMWLIFAMVDEIINQVMYIFSQRVRKILYSFNIEAHCTGRLFPCTQPDFPYQQTFRWSIYDTRHPKHPYSPIRRINATPRDTRLLDPLHQILPWYVPAVYAYVYVYVYVYIYVYVICISDTVMITESSVSASKPCPDTHHLS